ncbi:hypothetical protein V493_06680 [Pseudogymnoascus sp. VKM F-4281 (FW-2241)]|nr:hypothetical protein V493_06680 [Pseudogymnoascus sp. VKM F-4281 (FW-2241)]
MKFRDGMWLVAEGTTIEYAEQVYSITERADKKALSLLCPTRRISNRGDILNRSTLTIDIEAVSDGIISVESTHWAGAVRKGPNFELFPDGAPEVEATITTASERTVLSAGALTATVAGAAQPFRIDFKGANGRALTDLRERSVGLAYNPPISNMQQTGDMRNIKHHVFTQTTLGVGESVHGLGERFGPFNKVGQAVSLWNADGGTSSDQAYKNVSFWMSSRGYGVFIDTPERVELEIGSERCCRLQTSVEGQRLKWFIIDGPTPKDVLRRYAKLTGQASSVPEWSYGLWLSTSFTTDYDEQTVTAFLEGMKKAAIPVDVFHFDCFWLKAFQWCDFAFDKEKFPDPAGQIKRMKDSGLCKKVSVWTNPYLGQASPLFAEAAANGYLLKRKNGDVFQWDLWQAGMAIVDFTNPAAATWFQGLITSLLDLGIDSIKTDFGERIPASDVQWHDGSDPGRMHNYYAVLYNEIVYAAMTARFGPGESVLFARAAAAGSQRFPLQWGGDCESTPEAMAESLRGGLGFGLSGFAFWSVDIGGFEGNPPPWLYKRWVAFGLLCSHSRLHGSDSVRVPWAIDNNDQSDEGATAVLRTFVRLKDKLGVYIQAEAAKSVRDGLPLSLRAMCIEFPNDPTSWSLDRQFMLGESVLVAPVFEEDGSVEFYLPEGRWTAFVSGEVKEGPRWVKEVHRLDSVPLYVKEGTVLPLRAEGGEVSLKVYGIKAGEVGKVQEIVEGALKEREVTVAEDMLA